jgi:hypothetical protein
MHFSTKYYSYLRSPIASKQLNNQAVKGVKNGVTAYKSID